MCYLNEYHSNKTIIIIISGSQAFCTITHVT